MLDEPFELSRFIAKERKGKWPSCGTLAPACTALFVEPTVKLGRSVSGDRQCQP